MLHHNGPRAITPKLASLDKGGRALRPICLASILILLIQLPSWSQEAISVGLNGPVHTVLTEEFSDENGLPYQSRGSTFEIYDRRGYQLEVYQYNPDGSLWVHTINSRNGQQILKSQTTGTPPFANYSVQNFFDADGKLIETDAYDANGVLTQKVSSEFLERQPE